MRITVKLFFGTILAFFTLFLISCHRPSDASESTAFSNSPSCSSNPYLMKYHCSITEVQQAAENGNADAQYALGYMYYYGINTAKDRQTAELWIQRSAAQGQPLAKKAADLIHSGNAGSDFNQAVFQSTPEGRATLVEQQPSEDVDSMNNEKPKKPIKRYLPNYPDAQISKKSAPAQAQGQPLMDPRLAANAAPIAFQSLSNTTPLTTAAQPAGYTLQLMSSERLADVINFIGDNHISGARYYQVAGKGAAPRYILTYGHYATAGEAKTALRHLHALTQNGLRVKSIKAINALA